MMATPVAADIHEAAADFALRLLRSVARPQQNAFFSPVSVSVAVGMALTGAKHSTASQITRCMFGGLKDADILAGNAEAVTALNAKPVGYQLHTANRLYGQAGFELKAEFVDALRKHYASELHLVNFADADKVRAEINKWVEGVTHERIRDLIGAGVLGQLTRLVLVNAIYFKGEWRRKFEAEDTAKLPFYVSPNHEIQLDMMHQTNKFLYAEDTDVQILGMPYIGDEIAMFVFLPREKYGLEAIEKKLTGKMLIDLIKKTTYQEVQVSLPKFRLEESLSLKEHLQKLGMADMFNPDLADFSGMTGGKDLYVSAVVHKAFVEVNERGSEAAAATAVVMCMLSASMVPEPPPPRFQADHAFLFCIADARSQRLLFIGHHCH